MIPSYNLTSLNSKKYESGAGRPGCRDLFEGCNEKLRSQSTPLSGTGCLSLRKWRSRVVPHQVHQPLAYRHIAIGGIQNMLQFFGAEIARRVPAVAFEIDTAIFGEDNTFLF